MISTSKLGPATQAFLPDYRAGISPFVLSKHGDRWHCDDDPTRNLSSDFHEQKLESGFVEVDRLSVLLATYRRMMQAADLLEQSMQQQQQANEQALASLRTDMQTIFQMLQMQESGAYTHRDLSDVGAPVVENEPMPTLSTEFPAIPLESTIQHVEPVNYAPPLSPIGC
jgi:hypothetical protein